jgi:hypothetical protein
MRMSSFCSRERKDLAHADTEAKEVRSSSRKVTSAFGTKEMISVIVVFWGS